MLSRAFARQVQKIQSLQRRKTALRAAEEAAEAAGDVESAAAADHVRRQLLFVGLTAGRTPRCPV